MSAECLPHIDRLADLEIAPLHDALALQTEPDLGLADFAQVFQKRAELGGLMQVIGGSAGGQLCSNYIRACARACSRMQALEIGSQ